MKAIYAILLLFLCVGSINAQTEQSITINLKNIDIRSAIDAVFRNSDKNYAVAADVQGNIGTISLNNVPFDIALRNILNSFNLVYHITDEIYQIRKKSPIKSIETISIPIEQNTLTIETTSEKDIIIDTINLNYSTPSEILALMGYNGNNGAGYNTSSFQKKRWLTKKAAKSKKSPGQKRLP